MKQFRKIRKKAMATFLSSALAMILVISMTGSVFASGTDSGMPVQGTGTAAASAESGSSPVYWGGTADLSWYNTTDTSFDLTTPEQLAGLAEIVNGTATNIAADDFSGKTINIQDNIYLDTDGLYTQGNGVFGKSPYLMTSVYYTVTGNKLWTPIGTGSVNNSTSFTAGNAFRGTFNGNGHEISGLYTDGSKDVQGLFGYVGHGAIVEDVKVSGCVAANTVAGAVVAVVDGATVKNCVNNAVVYASGGEVAGSGTENGISEGGYIGGITGLAEGTAEYPANFSYNVNNADVVCTNTAKGGNAGGIVGKVKDSQVGKMTRCLNNGAIEAYQYSGGILGSSGSNAFPISESVNHGTVIGASVKKAYIGGIAGLDYSPVSECYNTGDIHNTSDASDTTRFAGIVGDTNAEDGDVVSAGKITDCYSVGLVSLTGSGTLGVSGNIVGDQAFAPVNCYYLSSSSLANAIDQSNTTGLSQAEFQSKSAAANLGSYYGQDTENLNNGYPVLVWQTGNEPSDADGHAVSVGVFPSGSASVSVEKSTASTDETVKVNIDSVASGKKIKQVMVTDAYGISCDVTKVSDSEYSFAMPSSAATVNVLTENIISDGAKSYQLSLPDNLDAIWNISYDAGNDGSSLVPEGSTVYVTVKRDSTASSASVGGIEVIADGQDVACTVYKTASGGYSTIGEATYEFEMPSADAQIKLKADYDDLQLFTQDYGSTSSVLEKTFTRTQLNDIAQKDAVYYSAYDSMPAAVVGKGEKALSLTELLAQSGIDFGEGMSLRIGSADGFTMTLSYDYLYGSQRFYFPGIASGSAEGKIPIDAYLVLCGYQERCADLQAQNATIDDKVCDTAYACRFVFGQTVTDFNDGVPDNSHKTAGNFAKYVTSLTVVEDEAQPTDLSTAKVTLPSSVYAYTGNEVRPVPSVVLEGEKLTLGQDYAVSYQNNNKTGTAKVVVSGLGDYSGSASVGFTITPRAVKGLKTAASDSSDAIGLTWGKVSEGSGYEAWQYISGAWKRIWKAASPSATSLLTEKYVKAGSDKFRVRAYSVVNGRTIYGAYSSVLTVNVPGKAVIKKISQGSGYATVTWKKTELADGYQLFLKKAGGKTYVLAGSVKGKASTSQKIKRLTSGKTYYCKVRAYHLSGKVKVYGAFSTKKSVKVR